MKIRPEKETEFPEIYQFVEEAFRTAKVSDGDEQNFVNRMRESGKYIPELALVAEDEGKIVGHIMFTRQDVTGGDRPFTGLLVAPLAVAMEYRSKGVGRALMEEGFRIARQMGYKAAFLIGDPDYYSRFGYRKSADFNIRYTQEIPEQYVQAYELEAGALKNVQGVFECLEA